MAIIKGTSAKNKLSGTGAADTMFGLAGDDTMNGNRGGDRMLGGTGNDILNGGSGNDTMLGEAGGDILSGGLGTDVLVGGDGNDYLGGGGIEILLDRDVSFALAQSRVIAGGSGNDTHRGGAGQDNFIGDPGRDVIDGGSGSQDWVTYQFSRSAVGFDLGGGGAMGGFSEGDRLIGIENAVGSNFNDVITGSNARNALFGLNGADYIEGGRGGDYMVGGAGADTFAFGQSGALFHSGFGPVNRDIIDDFNTTSGDVIDLQSVDADIFFAGDQQFDFIGTAGFGFLDHAMVNYFHDVTSNDTIVQVALAGNNSLDADFHILLSGIHNLSDDDFRL